HLDAGALSQGAGASSRRRRDPGRARRGGIRRAGQGAHLLPVVPAGTRALRRGERHPGRLHRRRDGATPAGRELAARVRQAGQRRRHRTSPRLSRRPDEAPVRSTTTITSKETESMYKPFDLTGHSALVTGGNGGIGLGMARALAQAGAHVAIWGSNPDKTARAREALVAEGLKVDAFTCDVGDEAAVERTFADTLSALGKVDSCFANAGVSSKGTFMVDMTLEEFRRVQRI